MSNQVTLSAETALAPMHELEFEHAAEHVSRRVPVAGPRATAGEIRRTLVGKRFDTASEVAICEDSRLLGLLGIEDLLAAPEEAVAADLMDSDPPVVGPGTDQELVAWKAVQHHESGLAVVDEQGKFQGLIRPERLLQVLLWEHDEDMARLGGFLRDTSSARRASEEPLLARLWHRLPWLLVGLAGAFLAADIVGAFESQLQKNLLLAFFVPGVVYLADAVGTQTESLVIRGLSLGIPISRMVRGELLTGLFVGLALSLTFFPVAWWRWGQSDIAFAVAVALFSACSIATGIAMALPWLLQRLGRDPAFGSGPLATVIQDLLSVVIYFAVALIIVK